ncbi:alpha-amylase [Streptomyces sp. NPDC048172]|uniref:alpha-amylase n=1 Tax=Streptomyces sp. NPDC048172 TaxID=3365505 RepID=UPI0037125546
MTALPAQPVVHEVNTRVWLREVTEQPGRPPAGLGDVPGEAWDALVPPGVDAVWLMGVWERSAEGRALALRDPELRRSFAEALGEVRDEDVAGSPYCIRRYEVDAALGGAEGLAAARAALATRGAGLILDYVPNHVAPDSPWAHEHPEDFVHGTAESEQSDPAAYLRVGGHVLARGRDPFFPPWPDVVQLNAFAPSMRRATTDLLIRIGGMCDGVRCDMAMLLMNDIFAKTWGQSAGPPPREDFWAAVLDGVLRHHPDMTFMAEAYWDLEWPLQQQGFGFCYDKRLYDRLLHENAASVRAHLTADESYQRRLVRFLENHDEPRAAAVLPAGKERAAAVVIATVPGATLWHEGQFAGRRVRVPVFLTRRPDERPDPALHAFHERLLAAVHGSGMRTGRWRLLECTGWPDNASYHDILSWCWTGPAGRHLVAVNLSPRPAQARIPLPWTELAARHCRLTDVLAGDFHWDRSGEELTGPGLYVGLEAWGAHVLAVEPG